MRKWILLLILISVVQIGCWVTPVLAQNKEDAAIKKVIENYFKGVVDKNSDLIMQQISTKYSSKDRNGKAVDYSQLRSEATGRAKRNTNVRGSDLTITNINVQNDKATLEMKYTLNILNKDTSKESTVKPEDIVSLVKEGGSWKIVKILPKSAGGRRP